MAKDKKKVDEELSTQKAAPEEIIEDNPIKEEVEAQKLSEVDEIDTPEHNISGQEVDIEDVEEETETQEGIAPEVDAIHEDTETAQQAEKAVKLEKGKESEKSEPKIKKASKNKTVKKDSKPRLRSKKYQEKVSKVDVDKAYNISEALDLVKQTSYSKFDGTVNLSIRLEKGKKTEDAARGIIRLPHGSGKSLKVVIVTEDVIEKIKKGWLGFDVLVSSPEFMPRLAQVAKILGPKGKMPNPKDGTVVDDPKSAVEDLGGKVVRYRADSGNNIHFSVGKVSWDNAKIEENLNIILKSLVRFKIASATLSATMGPGIKIITK